MLVVPTAADTGSLLSDRLPIREFATGSTLQKICDRGYVRIAVAVDAAGFCRRNSRSGRLEGVDIMLSRRMAQGIFGGSLFESVPRVEFVETTLAERANAVCSGRADFAIAVLPATSAYRRSLAFTSSYYGTSLAAFVRRDSGIESVTGIACAPLGVLVTTEDERYARQHCLGSELCTFESFSELSRALVEGIVEAVLTASAVFDGYYDEWGAVAKRLPLEFGSYQFAIAVPKGDEDLRAFLDEQVRDVMQRRYLSLGDACRWGRH